MKKQKIYSSILLVTIVLLGVVIPRGLIQCQKNMLMSKEGIVEIGSGNPYIGGEKRLYEHLKKVSNLYLSTIELSEGEMKELVVESSSDETLITKESAIVQASNFAVGFAASGDSMGVSLMDFKYMGDAIATNGAVTLYRSIDEEEQAYWKVVTENGELVLDGITGFPVYMRVKLEIKELLSGYDAPYVGNEGMLDSVPLVFGMATITSLNDVTDGMCDLTKTFPKGAVCNCEEKDQNITYKMTIEEGIKIYLEIQLDRELGSALFEMYFS